MSEPAFRLRFGPFEANPHTGELRNGGIPVKLARQAFEVLMLLTGRAGELVTREEIRRALWPNDTVVEWEHSINTAIKRIRGALNDSRESPRYVETLSRRGYRFIAPVEKAALPSSPSGPPKNAPADVPDPQSLSGKTVSHYRVEQILGRGGMGVVYRAEDLRLGRPVALKFLPAGYSSDPVATARFDREARTASSLNHPNICTIYEVDTFEERTFIAMELLEGETLRERLARRDAGGLPTSDLLDLAIQMAEALEAAHERGIIHRDIKPANIFLTRRGEIKVLDFGLARPAPRRVKSDPAGVGPAHPTLTGAAPGTPVYMSPEQGRAEELDARSDLYSLGLVLYEASTGFTEVPANGPLATLQAASPRLPVKFREIVARLLDRDREMRYQSAADAASELKRLRRDLVSDPGATAAIDPAHHITPVRIQWTRILGIVLLSCVVLVAAAFEVFRLWPPSQPEPPLLAQRLTSDPGYHVAADFSPDGKQVAYCWNGFQEKNYDLYALTLAGGEPRRLTTDPMVEFSPAWSPDGKSIAFLQGAADGVATLMVMPASGGPARKVSDTSMHVSPLYRRIEWSRDGRWIVMEGQASAQEGYPLYAVSMQTGERRQITHPAASQGDLSPALSQDGRLLAYVKDVGNGVGIPFLLPVTPDLAPDGEPERMNWPGFQNVIVRTPRWISGGRQLLFTSNRAGPTRLWRAARQGGSEPAVLASLGEDISFPAVSPDGRQLVFSRSFAEANIWSVHGEAHPPAPVKLTAVTQFDSVPEFSPDGSRIAFASDRSGFNEIWVANRNGERARQLTSYQGPVTGSPRWSPDGKWIAYDSRVEGQPDIYVIPSEGGPSRRLTNDPSVDVMPSWSPDGRWLYFCSSRTGSRQVWRIPSGGGAAEQITRFGGCAVVPSPDGQTLYYMKQPGSFSSLWKVPAGGGEELLVMNNVVDRSFALTNERLYYASREADKLYPELRYLDLSSNRTVLLLRLSGSLAAGIAIEAGGTDVFYKQVDRQGSNLMLVNQFR